MESKEVIITLLLIAIAVLFFGVYLILSMLTNIQKQLTSMNKLHKLYSDEVIRQTKIMEMSSLLHLKDYCIEHELYENAKMLNELIESDFPGVFKK